METGKIEEAKETKYVSTRSRDYPQLTLESCIRSVEEARKFGKTLTISHIAGEGSLKSGAFIRKRASLGYYGLITGRAENIQITDLSEKIINPLSEEEKRIALQKAFLTPELFKQLYDATEKGKPIGVDALGNILVRVYGIQPAGKDKFINSFIKSGLYAGLINYYDESKKQILFIAQHEGDASSTSNKTEASSNEKKEEHNLLRKDFLGEADFQAVELVLSSGKARIVVPKEITEVDAKKLKAQINILANIFD